MTPDEISELAEFLWVCCATVEAYGGRVAPMRNGTCCPWGAAFPDEESNGYPGAGTACVKSGLTWTQVGCFMEGFDGTDTADTSDKEMLLLGRRFREQALSGDGFR